MTDKDVAMTAAAKAQRMKQSQDRRRRAVESGIGAAGVFSDLRCCDLQLVLQATIAIDLQ